MLAERDKYQVKSNFGGEKIAMSIRSDDMPHIMGVLTDLYTNKRLAVLREYSTNAYDAHIETGVSRPIEVALPSRLSPFLSVRDFGAGLDTEDIRSIYAQYGRSTKRESNEAIGSFGLGCKSALTYCSQFTVESVKDGRKILVAIGRDEDGSGYMNVVSDTPSNDPRGTLVTVPVVSSDIDSFKALSAEFFAVWPSGSVLVGGKVPARFEGLKITDKLYIMPKAKTSQVVMGNVAYPAPALASVVRDGAMLAFVDIGAVTIPPSREGLMDTDKTRKALKQITDDITAGLKQAIQRDIDACSTHSDAVGCLLRWQKAVSTSVSTSADFSYRGDKLPAQLDLPDRSQTKMNSRYEALGGASQLDALAPMYWGESVFVTNFTPANVTASHTRKVRRWAEQVLSIPDKDVIRIEDGDRVEFTYREKTGMRMIVFVPTDGQAIKDFPWIDNARIVDYATIRAIQLPSERTSVAGGRQSRISGSFDVYHNGSIRVEMLGADFPDVGNNIFYFHGNRYSARDSAAQIASLYRESLVVCLSANRIDKFVRETGAVTVAVAIDKKRTEWLASLTNDQKVALSMSRNGTRASYAPLEKAANRLADPDLRAACRISKLVEATLIAQWRSFGQPELGVTQGLNPLVKYPLYNRYVAVSNLNHTIMYLNAAYAAQGN